MPVVVVATMKAKPESVDAVREACTNAVAAVHEEPGCELYAITDAPDGTIVMIEKWTSAELLDAHGAGQPVADLNVANDGLLATPVEVTRLVPIPVGDAVKGAL